MKIVTEFEGIVRLLLVELADVVSLILGIVANVMAGLSTVVAARGEFETVKRVSRVSTQLSRKMDKFAEVLYKTTLGDTFAEINVD